MADAPKISPSQSKAADVACSWLPGALETQCRVDVAKKEAQQKDTFIFLPLATSDKRQATGSEGKGAAPAPAEERHYKSRRLPFFDFSQYAGESWLERITRQLRLRDDLPRLPRNFQFFPARPQDPPPADVCGDSSCTGAETAESCAADCASAVVPTPDAAVPVETPDAALPQEDAALPVEADAALPPPEQDAAVPEPDAAAEEPPVRHLCDDVPGDLPLNTAVTFVPGRDTITSVDVGDVNGDGLQDVVIGSQFEDKVYVVLGRQGEDRFAAGSTINLVQDADVVLEAGRSSFGSDIVIKDIDHDGIDDIVIGIRSFDINLGTGAYLFVYGRNVFQGANQNGQIHIALGAAVLANDATLRQQAMGLLVGSPNENIGDGIKFTGDVNGDGQPDMVLEGGSDTYADILPARPVQGRTTVDDLWNALGNNVRANYVIGTNGIGTSPAMNILSADFNGDGHDDLVVPDGTDVKVIQGGANLPDEIRSPIPEGNWFRIHGQDANWSLGSPTSIGDVDGDGMPDLLIAQAQAPVTMGGQVMEHAGKVFMIPGAGLQVAMANDQVAWGGDYEIENLMAITGGIVLKGTQPNGQIGLNGLAAAPNSNPNVANNMVVGAIRFNGSGCAFVVCGDAVNAMDMRQVTQRNVAQVPSIEGDPNSASFGSLTKSTRLGTFIRQGMTGQEPGAGVLRLFRNP